MIASHLAAELTFGTPGALKNLGVLTHKVYALGENTLPRIRARETTTGTAAGINSPSASATAPAMSQVWMRTLIGPLTMRTIALHALPDDIIVAAMEIKDIVVRAFTQAEPSDDTEGKNVPLAALPYRAHAQSASSWPGFLPMPEGWQVVDYVPAAAFRILEKQGRVVAVRSSGPTDMPPSLLDQKALTVSDGTGETTVDTREGQSQEMLKNVVDVVMRGVFVLCATGLIPKQPDEKKPVRVSAKGWWHRLDGWFGSIFTLESFGVPPLAN